MHTRDSGISLLIVLLVAGILLVAAGSFGGTALRLVQTSGVQYESVQGQYAAESAFWCVRYWLHQDGTLFDDTPGTITCNGNLYDLSIGASSGVNTNGDPVDTTQVDIQVGVGHGIVDIERIQNSFVFAGSVIVRGYGGDPGSSRAIEKYHEYAYDQPSYDNSDIVFVIERSSNMSNSAYTGIRYIADQLMLAFPSAQVGVAPFGTRPHQRTNAKSGDAVQDCKNAMPWTECEPLNYKTPERTLTGNRGAVISYLNNPGSSGYRTNIAFGLSIAASELFGKYYPWYSNVGANRYSGCPHTVGGNSTRGLCPSDFEYLVQTTQDFSTLATQENPSSNADPNHDKYIVLITAGGPTDSVGRRITTSPPRHYDGVVYRAGFNTSLGNPTRSNGDCGYVGSYIQSPGAFDAYYATNEWDLAGYSINAIAPYSGYVFYESSVTVKDTDRTPSTACFVELTANALKKPGNDITIMALSVGNTFPQGDRWLADRVVSVDPITGQPYFYAVNSPSQVGAGLARLLGLDDDLITWK